MLGVVGPALEARYGAARFTAIYLGLGAAGWLGSYTYTKCLMDSGMWNAAGKYQEGVGSSPATCELVDMSQAPGYGTVRSAADADIMLSPPKRCGRWTRGSCGVGPAAVDSVGVAVALVCDNCSGSSHSPAPFGRQTPRGGNGRRARTRAQRCSLGAREYGGDHLPTSGRARCMACILSSEYGVNSCATNAVGHQVIAGSDRPSRPLFWHAHCRAVCRSAHFYSLPSTAGNQNDAWLSGLSGYSVGVRSIPQTSRTVVQAIRHFSSTQVHTLLLLVLLQPHTNICIHTAIQESRVLRRSRFERS
jgi:hypothetical protein